MVGALPAPKSIHSANVEPLLVLGSARALGTQYEPGGLVAPVTLLSATVQTAVWKRSPARSGRSGGMSRVPRGAGKTRQTEGPAWAKTQGLRSPWCLGEVAWVAVAKMWPANGRSPALQRL